MDACGHYSRPELLSLLIDRTTTAHVHEGTALPSVATNREIQRPSYLEFEGNSTAVRDIRVWRFSVVSSNPFSEIVQHLTASIGQPDMKLFHKAIAEATTVIEMEDIVHKACGSSDLMEFIRFDSGEVVHKGKGLTEPNILRLVVGDPIIMKEMTKLVPDAASYAPVTILVDERIDGVHLSYDSMASLIAPYGNRQALAVAKDLDTKIQNLLTTVASGSEMSAPRITASAYSLF